MDPTELAHAATGNSDEEASEWEEIEMRVRQIPTPLLMTPLVLFSIGDCTSGEDRAQGEVTEKSRQGETVMREVTVNIRPHQLKLAQDHLGPYLSHEAHSLMVLMVVYF